MYFFFLLLRSLLIYFIKIVYCLLLLLCTLLVLMADKLDYYYIFVDDNLHTHTRARTVCNERNLLGGMSSAIIAEILFVVI